jgi:hypothetical protein
MRKNQIKIAFSQRLIFRRQELAACRETELQRTKGGLRVLSVSEAPVRAEPHLPQFAKVALVKAFPLPLPANAFLVPKVGFEDLP